MIFYVHPKTTMSRQCVMPFSVPALVNRLKYPVKGKFPDELTDEDIKGAKIIFIDIHWYLSLYGAQILVERIKTINKDCKVIAGGITASEYPKSIIENFGVDFVVRGDAEIPFPLLVEKIMENQTDFETIPNLYGKDGLITPRKYILKSAEMEENEYLDIDFFPSFKKEIHKIQKNNVSPWSEIIYPYMIPFRGCPIECIGCAGGITEQSKLFGRKPIMRSADRLRDDFERCEKDPDIHFVNIYHDFLTLMNYEYAFNVLKKPMGLNLRMEFNAKPEMEHVELLTSHFGGGVINFSIDKKHLTSTDLIDPDHMVSLIKRVQREKNFFTVLSYNSIFARNNLEYQEGLRYIIKKTRCLISDEAFYWTEHPIPDKNGLADEDMFQLHIEYSKDKKFVKSNLVKLYDSTEPYLPKKLTLGIRKTQQWLAQNLMYELNSLRR